MKVDKMGQPSTTAREMPLAGVTQGDKKKLDFNGNAYYSTYLFVEQNIYNVANTTSDQKGVGVL